MSAPRETDLSFTTALDHAIHIRRLYQHLIDEMKLFEAAWGKSAERHYRENLFLQDMHRDVMEFRDAPTDAPIQDREPLSPILNKTQSRPQYKPTLPVTKPFMAPSERRGEDPPTSQTMDSEGATAGPSRAGITLEVGCSTGRHHSLKGKARVTQFDEAPAHSEASGSTSTARHRSSKGKDRESQPDEAPAPNDDNVVPTIKLGELTEPAGVPEDNNAPSDSGPRFVRQKFERNYTTVGTITADTDRYQAPPNHPPVLCSGTYRLATHARQTSAPTTQENPHGEPSHQRDESRVNRHRRAHLRSNIIPSSARGHNPPQSRLLSPVLDRGAMPRNEADQSSNSHNKRPTAGKRRQDNEVEEDGERRTRSQKRSRRN